MIVDGEKSVAKALVDIGPSCGDVLLQEALRHLSVDLVHLKQMEFFAKAFFVCVAQECAKIMCVVFSYI